MRESERKLFFFRPNLQLTDLILDFFYIFSIYKHHIRIQVHSYVCIVCVYTPLLFGAKTNLLFFPFVYPPIHPCLCLYQIDENSWNLKTIIKDELKTIAKQTNQIHKSNVGKIIKLRFIFMKLTIIIIIINI